MSELKDHEVKINIWKQDGKWVVRISGITSGFEVNMIHEDNAAISFQLDASRFKPIVRQER